MTDEIEAPELSKDDALVVDDDRFAPENVALVTDHDGVRSSLTSLEYIYEWLAGEKPYNLSVLRNAKG